MQAKQLFPGKTLTLAIVAIIAVLPFVISCKETDQVKKDALTPEMMGSSNDSTFKMNCLVLRKAQVQKWVDSGWTQPGNQKIKALLMQFSFSTLNLNNAMRLTTFPGKSWWDVRLGGKTLLEIDTACVPVPFSGAVLGNNSIDLQPLNIIDSATGELGSFDFIRFKPKLDDHGYLVFDVEVVNQGVTVMFKVSNPCPPCQYCPQGCPETEFPGE